MLAVVPDSTHLKSSSYRVRGGIRGWGRVRDENSFNFYVFLM